MRSPFSPSSLLATALLAALTGCGDGSHLQPVPVGDVPSFDDFRSMVFQEPDTGIYIVDGDVTLLDDAALEAWYLTHIVGLQPEADPGPDNAHGPIGEAHQALIINRTRRRDERWGPGPVELTYCVSTTFGPRYQAVVDAMDDAIEGWRIGDLLSFRHISAEDTRCDANNHAVTFDVRPVWGRGDEYLARAFSPQDPRWARNILVDETAHAWHYAQFVALLEHELGHALGFNHEFKRPEAMGRCTFGRQPWRALTDYDIASVMHHPNCRDGSTFSSISPADRQGLFTVYGSPIGDRGGFYPTRWCGGSGQVFTGDFDGDRRADLLCHDPVHGRHWIDLSHGAGEFDGTDIYRGAAFCSHPGAELHLGDFDGDGRTDWLCHDRHRGDKWIITADREGRFDGPVWHRDARWCHHAGARLHVGDVDGDGRDDLLCHDDHGRLWTDLADRRGRFHGTDWSRHADWCGHQGARLYLEDFDGDGRSDLFCHDDNGTMWLDHADARGRFYGTDWARNARWCNHGGARLHLGDLNADGRTDLLCHDENDGATWVDLADRAGRFDGIHQHRRGEYCVMPGGTLSLADLNADRRADALCHDAVTGDKWVAFSAL